MEETKRGRVADVIFYNEENGYTICVVEREDPPEQFTAVGHLCPAAKGRSFAFTGKWVQHPRYGEQFSFSSYEEEAPGSEEAIREFLASGLLKGIGPKTAEAIVRQFGKETMEILEKAPERLAEVPGIGPVKAAAAAESYRGHRELAEITLALQQYGLPASTALRLYRVYGAQTPQILQEDPYRLIDDVFGIGFRKADEIAAKLGMAQEHPRRLESGLLFTLRYYAGEGSTYVPRGELIEKTAQLLEVGRELLEDALPMLAFQGSVSLEELEGRSVVYLTPLYEAERGVAARLLRLDRAALAPVCADPEAQIRQAERDMGAALSAQQRKAVRAAAANGVTVITGGPGTGKTTIITAILSLLEAGGLKVALAAPTGRAAKRITQTTGHEASTLHRLLEYSNEDGAGFRFKRNEEEPLDCGAVIVDEVSMVDVFLMAALLEALPAGCRLILVGDADQLPSVGPGNVLRDILQSDAVGSIRLTEIFRQASESLIVVNAHRINRGEYPDLNQRDKDFFFLTRHSEAEMLETIKDLCVHRLPERYPEREPVRDLQILTPVRKGTLGSLNLNRELQQVLNPPAPEKPEKTYGRRLFRLGDKVMQIRNNYDLEWRRFSDFESGRGVFNGDMGLVAQIDPDYNELTVLYDDGKYVKYEADQLEELELAYAVTVHKSQGCEFPVVIMPVSWFPPMLATRNLFYTAVTRARELVVLVGSPGKMEAMVDNNSSAERYSGLAPRLAALLGSPLI